MIDPKGPVWRERRNLGIEVGVSHDEKSVIIDMPVETDNLLLHPQIARALAASIIRHADLVEGKGEPCTS